MRRFDFIIVGQGLAGSALAWELRRVGASFLVIDSNEPFTSSRVAAGLITPVTGQRLAKTWRLEPLWKFAVEFYAAIQAESGMELLHELGMVRLFKDAGERDAFESRAGSILLGHVQALDRPVDDSFEAAHGAFAMMPAGRLDVRNFLKATRSMLERGNSFQIATIDPGQDVVPEPQGAVIPSLNATAKAVVFCQGFVARDNPWFPKTQFIPAKGEILTLKIDGLTETRIVHRGVWLLPLGNGLFRSGSTYDRDTLDTRPTDAGRAEIVGKLREFLRLPIEVIDHVAAVRPIVRDQTPMIGVHAEHRGLAYFNGLGSKGSLQAPYFARQLAAFLTGRGVIEREVDVARTWKK